MQKLTAKLVEEKLRECDGNLAQVARLFGVTRQAVWDYINRHPSLQPVVRDCRETMKDDGEASLTRAVKAGEAWAVCFYLKTQAKDRGYVERTETATLPGDKPPVVEVVVRTRREAKELLGLKDEGNEVKSGEGGTANSSDP